MDPLQFKYVITWTQHISPSQWDIQKMSNHLIKLRNQAYDTEAKLIEQAMDRRGYVDAQTVIKKIMEKQ